MEACISSDRAPTVDGDRVYAGNVCTPISRATGQPVAGWEHICTADDHAAVPFHRGHLFADLYRGRGIAFAFDVTRGIATAGIGASFPPAVIGNVAVTSDVYNVSAREFPTGTPRWKWTGPATQDIVMPPLIVGRTVYVVLDSPGLRALDLDTGQVVFSQSLGVSFPEHYTAGQPRGAGRGRGAAADSRPRAD